MSPLLSCLPFGRTRDDAGAERLNLATSEVTEMIGHPELVIEWVESLDEQQLSAACEWAMARPFLPGQAPLLATRVRARDERLLQRSFSRASPGIDTVLGKRVRKASWWDEDRCYLYLVAFETIVKCAIRALCVTVPLKEEALRGEAIDALRELMRAIEFFDTRGEDLFSLLVGLAQDNDILLEELGRIALTASGEEDGHVLVTVEQTNRAMAA